MLSQLGSRQTVTVGETFLFAVSWTEILNPRGMSVELICRVMLVRYSR